MFRQKKTSRIRIFSLVFAVAGGLALSACSDDDDDNGGQNDAGMNDSATDDSGADLSTIAELAAGDDQFSTLVAALQKADLVDTLGSAGPFTVFAPNNAAFTASGITDLDAVSVEDLTQILLYHVVSGAKVMSSDVTAGPVETAAELTAFLGTEGGVSLNGGNAVTGGANVAVADIEASNGVIHVIDRVILPPDIPTCAQYGGLTELLTAVGAAAGIPDDGSSTPLAEALTGADLTVFAPTNAAFTAVSTVTSGLSAAELRDVLLYHVVGAEVPSDAIPQLASSLLNNAYGNPVSIWFDTSDGVKVNKASVAIADIKCTNGIVHVIDSVILPPNVVEMADIAGLTSLIGAVGSAADIDQTPVADALAAQEPYTVFAPTNAAFEAVSSVTAGLSAEELRDVLLLHVVNTEDTPVLSTGLPASAPSLLGQQLTIVASGPTVAGPGNETPANIGPVDINVTNGVVHVVDAVLLPAGD
jgi:transforming growth factor-beta-induced protein